MVVPARAGMSPSVEISPCAAVGGPRASGDEPALHSGGVRGDEWSPRERG